MAHETRLSIEDLSKLRNQAKEHFKRAQSALLDDNISDEEAFDEGSRALNCLSKMITEPEEVEIHPISPQTGV